MGLADRDAMRERRSSGDQPFRPPATRSASLLTPILFWIVLCFVLYLGFSWWEQRQRLPRDRQQAGASRPPALPARSRETVVASPSREVQPANSFASQSAGPVRKCMRDGATSYSDGNCMPGARDEVVTGLPAAVPSSLPPAEPRASGVTPGTIYLCKAYDGGTFWAQAHCNQHRSHIERIARVPDGLPFDQQVDLARNQMGAASPAPALAVVPAAPLARPDADSKARCAALEAEIKWIDDTARQPQGPQMQDWLAAKRKQARGEQFRIPCR